MYLPLTLISLSAASWPTSLPENNQAAVGVPITSPTPTPVIASFGKRQHGYTPVETSKPMLEVLAGSAADVLKERASGGDSFDSLLCATLKALKGENPATFTSLLQSCTSLIDSSSHGRVKTLRERDLVNKKRDVEAIDNRLGEAVLGRSETDLLEKRGLGINNIV